jgi:RNA polymerase sigma-70 factor (ECF subfamily)
VEEACRLGSCSNEVLLEKLMDLYGDDLKRIAFLYVNDYFQCEDIVQEVFISAFNSFSSFRNEANYKTWLIRITINKCKDHQKRWSIRNMIYKPFTQLFMEDKSASVEEEFFQNVLSNDLLQALSKLSPKYKDILVLYYFQDMNIVEIAAILETKINTVKSRLARGREQLKKAWKGGSTIE